MVKSEGERRRHKAYRKRKALRDRLGRIEAERLEKIRKMKHEEQVSFFVEHPLHGPELSDYTLHRGELMCRRYSELRMKKRLLSTQYHGGVKRCYTFLAVLRAARGGYYYLCPTGEHWHRTSRPGPDALPVPATRRRTEK